MLLHLKKSITNTLSSQFLPLFFSFVLWIFCGTDWRLCLVWQEPLGCLIAVQKVRHSTFSYLFTYLLKGVFTESCALTQAWRKATFASLLAVFWQLTCWEALPTVNELPNVFEMENFWSKWASRSFQLLATVWQNNCNICNRFAEAAYLTIRAALNIYLKLVGFKYWRALFFSLPSLSN